MTVVSSGSKPSWLRAKAPQRVGSVKQLLRDLGLNTVCEEASCPNLGECFANGTATFLIMGPACTRACPYCDIDFTKRPLPLDATEPLRVAEAVERLGLRHAVITSVNRDDLPDGGASQFVACIAEIRRRMPQTTIEVLIPDLCGNWQALQQILAARPTVLNHNTETVPRLYRRVRPQGNYERSLKLLELARQWDPGLYTKSGVMLGLGETAEEILQVMRDLRRVGDGASEGLGRLSSGAFCGGSGRSAGSSASEVARRGGESTIGRLATGLGSEPLALAAADSEGVGGVAG